MRLVHYSCAGLPWVCAPPRTGSNIQYSHVRCYLGASVDLLLRRGSAGCARCVAISRRNQYVTAGADFKHVDYLSASCARRNRAQAAEPTQLGGLADTSSAVYCRTHGRSESIKGTLCNQVPPVSQKRREVAVTSVTSTQPRRLSGRAHYF